MKRILLLIFLLVPLAGFGQDNDAYRIQVQPEQLTLPVGDTASVAITVFNEDGNPMEMPVRIFSRNRDLVAVDRASGDLIALKPGDATLVAMVRLRTGEGQQRFMQEFSVNVPFPPLASIDLGMPATRLFTLTETPVNAIALDETGATRPDVDVVLRSSNPEIASMNAFGDLVAHAPGTITLFAEGGDLRAEQSITVADNPIVSLALTAPAEVVRTGDVVPFSAVAKDLEGRIVDDASVSFSFIAQPDDALGNTSTGQILSDGRFVAEKPGRYTIFASTGSAVAQKNIRVNQRDVTREIEQIGQGLVGDVFTSDLWVWEGVDGRDYAVTGTWSANGEAYFWDVTNPELPTIIDTVTVDARTVNDVKVNEAGTVCVISREGASNRRNGLVILDCRNPYEVQVLAEYDENLTGGVHNVFIYQNHIYALSAGQRYDIINIEDPSAPKRVGSFELDEPGHAIHDVWVEDGIAYSSNWTHGVVMVDVGNGIAGGSPENPVKITSYAYPSGWNHAAFPYHDKKTGKRYIIAGDEHFIPSTAANMYGGEEATGWIHFIDVTDLENPKEVARYEVPEAGTHNLWVEGDTLYVAYYQGGLRVVDISGDLMGNLYEQGREIAVFKGAAAGGKIANSPMAWGPQPYKGNIFFSDHNSGLWVVRLKQDEKEKKPDI